uniref:Uncharacterized protein n=1 Tax=Oscillatoriales cyanobacterium SpSt-418 TaxID=2282169 RepID=A0A7C3PKM1_9CYAN
MAYLQTLPSDEAIALVASLQKVKDHLAEELEWMNQQVQQKTTQLRGLETLLAEASSLGLAKAGSRKVAAPPTEVLKDGTTENNQEIVASGSLNALTSALERLPAKTSQKPKESSKDVRSKPQTQAKATTRAENRPTKAKQTSSTPISRTRSPSNKPKELRDLLFKKYQGKTFGDIADQLLTRANKPVHVDDLMLEMYGNLSPADYKRAKLALAKLLSAGKLEGKWQSFGQGTYAANGVAAP